MNKAKAAEIFKRLKIQRPEPVTELEYQDEFTLLVAIVLSAQATDKSVNKATPALFKAAPTPQKMAALGEDKIREFIKTIGLYNAKAKNVYALSKMLIEKFGGKIPATREELEILPGVGRKTANVFLNNARGEATMGVDTNIFRVSNRTHLTHAKNPRQTEEQLLKITPPEYLLHAHHWLLLHGRYTCVARQPRCYECVIVDLCEFKDKNL